MKRRWKAAIVFGAIAAILLSPVAYIEVGCRSAPNGWPASTPYASLMPGTTGKRPEARSWLTYPEWYIVYSAESYGRYLAAGKPPSGYGYWSDITGFWSGLCAVNRAAGVAEAGDAKLMLYTIGLSFTIEMAVKSAYENVSGRIAEWIGGWNSENDRYSARVWQRYGAFMHETPWYKFPFADAAGGLWKTSGGYRNWERRLALSTEYGVKAGYGWVIGYASDAALDAAQPSLPLIARGTPAEIAAIDPRLKPVRTLPNGLVLVEAPRYAQFTELLGKLAKSRIELVEIAGNDDILVTMLLPEKMVTPVGAFSLFEQPLGDRPGWRRSGAAVKVMSLLPLLRETAANGGEIEHVYDY